MRKLITIISILLVTTASYAQTYTVESIIDGDTITVTSPEGKLEKVQLIGTYPNDSIIGFRIQLGRK